METFEIREQFYLNGQPFRIISGAVHYFRTVPQYWRDRLEKLRNLGCNTVETYIPWNLHEPRQKEFCFEGLADIEGFLTIAQELGLYIILRPSPYICSEWEFGGLPAWLLKDRSMRLRCSYGPFQEAVRAYYEVLIPKLTPYQVDRGGSMILMQLENEYGYSIIERYYYVPCKYTWDTDNQPENPGTDIPIDYEDEACAAVCPPIPDSAAFFETI